MFEIGDIITDGTNEYIVQDIDTLTEPIPKYLINDEWQFCIEWKKVEDK